MIITECDFLIIGSGAGGATVAEYLSSQGFAVHMIEEGEQYIGGADNLSETESLNRKWRSSGITPAFGTPNITYAEARCLGGGTEINSGIIQRIPPSVRADWIAAEPNNRHFFEQQIDEYYDEIDGRLSVSLEPFTDPPPKQRHSDLLKEAADTQGWASEKLPRAVSQCSCARPLCICGGRQSMTNMLIKTSVRTGRLTISSRTKVRKLVIQNERVKAVVADEVGTLGEVTRKTIRPKHVFMCAGAIQTPHLLMKSGVNFKGLGKFQLHPTVRVVAEFADEIDAVNQPLPNYAITEFMPKIRFGGSVSTPGVIGMALAENWTDRNYLQRHLAKLAFYYVMIKPLSWGQIRSLPLLADPLVTYRLSNEDVGNLSHGINLLCSSLLKIGALRVHPSIKNHPGWDGETLPLADVSVQQLRRSANLMSIHVFSSCSTQNNRQVFTGNGRIGNIQNLVIADGACLPSAPGVNPQATIMAIAKHNAVTYLGRL